MVTIPLGQLAQINPLLLQAQDSPIPGIPPLPGVQPIPGGPGRPELRSIGPFAPFGLAPTQVVPSLPSDDEILDFAGELDSQIFNELFPRGNRELGLYEGISPFDFVGRALGIGQAPPEPGPTPPTLRSGEFSAPVERGQETETILDIPGAEYPPFLGPPESPGAPTLPQAPQFQAPSFERAEALVQQLAPGAFTGLSEEQSQQIMMSALLQGIASGGLRDADSVGELLLNVGLGALGGAGAGLGIQYEEEERQRTEHEQRLADYIDRATGIETRRAELEASIANQNAEMAFGRDSQQAQLEARFALAAADREYQYARDRFAYEVGRIDSATRNVEFDPQTGDAFVTTQVPGGGINISRVRTDQTPRSMGELLEDVAGGVYDQSVDPSFEMARDFVSAQIAEGGVGGLQQVMQGLFDESDPESSAQFLAQTNATAWINAVRSVLPGAVPSEPDFSDPSSIQSTVYMQDSMQYLMNVATPDQIEAISNRFRENFATLITGWLSEDNRIDQMLRGLVQ